MSEIQNVNRKEHGKYIRFLSLTFCRDTEKKTWQWVRTLRERSNSLQYKITDTFKEPKLYVLKRENNKSIDKHWNYSIHYTSCLFNALLKKKRETPEIGLWKRWRVYIASTYLHSSISVVLCECRGLLTTARSTILSELLTAAGREMKGRLTKELHWSGWSCLLPHSTTKFCLSQTWFLPQIVLGRPPTLLDLTYIE